MLWVLIVMIFTNDDAGLKEVKRVTYRTEQACKAEADRLNNHGQGYVHTDGTRGQAACSQLPR